MKIKMSLGAKKSKLNGISVETILSVFENYSFFTIFKGHRFVFDALRSMMKQSEKIGK